MSEAAKIKAKIKKILNARKKFQNPIAAGKSDGLHYGDRQLGGSGMDNEELDRSRVKCGGGFRVIRKSISGSNE